MIVLMGVSGAGKTTVGKLLASELGWIFADADDYHSAANIEKMRSGIPLTDEDRAPWLEALRKLISDWVAGSQNAILACSALKDSYRQRLRVAPEVQIVYLKVSTPELHRRLRARQGHYMTDQMLVSQLATLEEPKDAVVIDGDVSPDETVGRIVARLGLTQDLKERT